MRTALYDMLLTCGSPLDPPLMRCNLYSSKMAVFPPSLFVPFLRASRTSFALPYQSASTKSAMRFCITSSFMRSNRNLLSVGSKDSDSLSNWSFQCSADSVHKAGIVECLDLINITGSQRTHAVYSRLWHSFQ